MEQNQRSKCSRLGRKTLHFCTDCNQLFCVNCLTATIERAIAPALSLLKALERRTNASCTSITAAKQDGETKPTRVISCTEIDPETVTSISRSVAIFGKGTSGEKMLPSGTRRLAVFGDQDEETLRHMDSIMEAFAAQLKSKNPNEKVDEKAQFTKIAAKMLASNSESKPKENG